MNCGMDGNSLPTVDLTPKEEAKKQDLLRALREESRLAEKRQTSITQFTTSAPSTHNFPLVVPTHVSHALLHQQIYGKLPPYQGTYSIHRLKTPRAQPVDAPQPQAHPSVLTADEIAPTEAPEVVLQQGMGGNRHWSNMCHLQSVQQGQWKPRGGTPLLPDYEIRSYLQDLGTTSQCDVQQFDHFGSLLACGYSHGEVYVHDRKELLSQSAVLSSKYQNRSEASRARSRVRNSTASFTGCNIPITSYPLDEREGLGYLWERSSSQEESYFVFNPPLIRFTPFTPLLEKFDLERCVESYDDQGQPAFAQPIRQMGPRNTHHGQDASGPTALCSDSTQPSLLWSCARDGRVRMWDDRVQNRYPSQEHELVGELNAIEFHDGMLWTCSSEGLVHALDARKSTGGQKLLRTTSDGALLASFSPTALLQVQTPYDCNFSTSTRRLCALKILDHRWIVTLSGDGTVVVFDPFQETVFRMSEFNNATLSAFFQSSLRPSETPLHSQMLSTMPTPGGPSLLVLPAHGQRIALLDVHGPQVVRELIPVGFGATSLASAPFTPDLAVGYGGPSRFGSLLVA